MAKAYFVPFYPELVGLPIPGTDKLTNNGHAMLMGAYISFDTSDKGCFANSEALSERTLLSEKNIINIRSELLKLGWISVKRNKYNKITNVYPQLELALNRGASSHSLNPLQAGAGTPFKPQLETKTDKPPLSENKVNIKNVSKLTSSTGVTPVADINVDVVDKGSSREEISDLPFDDDVVTHSIRPDKEDETSRLRRGAWALANEFQKKLGLATKPHVGAVKNIIALLGDGVKMEDIKALFAWTQNNEFYKTQTLQTRMAKSCYERWKLDANGGDDGWRPGQGLRWDKDHTMLVKCDPETGEIIRYD